MFAEKLATEYGPPVLYLATATSSDPEMSARIALHRQRRPAAWRTVESPLSLHVAIGDARTVLVEDLTLLLNNLMAGDPGTAEGRATAEVNALLGVTAHVIVVSNEVGMGIVPATAVGGSSETRWGG